MTPAGAPGGPGPAVEDVGGREAVGPALERLGLGTPRPVLVVVGGAAGMAEEHLAALRRLLSEHVLPILSRHGAAVVDGGTHAGVMRVTGEVVAGTGVPLLGVAAAGTVRTPGRPDPAGDAADLDPGHTAVLLVPGTAWGDESPWIATVAAALAGPRPCVTLLVNGGEIAYADARHSVDAGRPVIVLAGTGRTADAIAAALRGEEAGPRARELARSAGVRAVPIGRPDELTGLLDRLLGGQDGP